MEAARRRGIGGSVAVPGHLEAIQDEVHHRSFRGVSRHALSEQAVVVALPLIEQVEDAEYG